MRIFENFNRAKQKFGENLAKYILNQGIPDNYLFLACKFYKEEQIPIDTLKQKFRQWMSYIRNLGEETINVNKLGFQQFNSILRDAMERALKPNPIFDNGIVFMGEFKNKEEALLYPVPNNWCTSNSASKFKGTI